MELPLLPLQTQ